MGCLEEGRLLWDNNLAENVIRPITLGRKNYLFCGNHEAAVNMSVICSLPTTCKAHDVNPRDYLNNVIARMPYHKKATHEGLLELLSHKWKLQYPESALTKQEENLVPMLTATYRFNKIIATATIRFIVTVAIVVYKDSIPVV